MYQYEDQSAGFEASNLDGGFCENDNMLHHVVFDTETTAKFKM